MSEDAEGPRVSVRAFDVASGKPAARFTTGDRGIRGIACGNGRLWLSSASGNVYEVDPTQAAGAGALDGGLIRTFAGHYDRLAFGNGQLWAVDNQAQRICKIHLSDSSGR